MQKNNFDSKSIKGIQTGSKVTFKPSQIPNYFRQPQQSLFVNNQRCRSSFDDTTRELTVQKRYSLLNTIPKASKFNQQTLSPLDLLEEELKNLNHRKVSECDPLFQSPLDCSQLAIDSPDTVLHPSKKIAEHYGNITKITQQQNKNLKQQNQYLLKQLTRVKQKTIKLNNVYNSKYNQYKQYKQLHFQNLSQMESLEKQAAIYMGQCQELADIMQYDFERVKEKLQREIIFTQSRNQIRQKYSGNQRKNINNIEERNYGGFHNLKKQSVPTTQSNGNQCKVSREQQDNTFTFDGGQ